jgi:disulfide bond formation protein DsbB
MDSPRLPAFVVFLGSAGLLGGALLFQYVGGLPPCQLCHYQRWPYIAVLALSFIAIAVGDKRLIRWVMGVCVLLFILDAGLAFYHVGVEQHWFAGPTTCSGPGAGGDSVEALKLQILGQKPVRCDEIPWSLFGISLAGWNFLGALALAIFSLLACRRMRGGAS